MSPPPWDVYRRQMFELHLGWAMWDPEPVSVNELWDIGSVIYPAPQGRYQLLFDATKPASDNVDGKESPRDHVPFVPSNVYGPRKNIMQSVMFSKTIKSSEVGAEAGAGDPTTQISASAGFKFVCKDNSGAVLVLEPPGVLRVMQSKRRIVTYIREHFDSWLELAGARDIEATQDQLYFVSGTTKTTKWVTAVVMGGSYRHKEGHIQCDFTGAANINVSIKVANEQLTSNMVQVGPTHGTERSQRRITVLGEGEEIHEGNQCIFIHYYKMKKRYLWRSKPIKAAAGPHDLPSDGGESGGDPVSATQPPSDDSDIEESQQSSPGFDPVDVLLDFVLETTQAQSAIGTDRDITALFPNGVPENLSEALVELNPSIDIDEHGVATVDVDIRIPETAEGEGAVESVPAASGGEASAAKPEDIGDHPPSGGEAAAVGQEPAQPAAGSSLQEGGDDGTEGLTEEEAARRRLQKQPIIWEPAANGHTGTVTSLAVSPDSKWVASGSEDTTIILWDTEDQSVVRKWEASVETVWHLAFSPDSQRLAASGNEGRVVIWDVEQGDELGTLEGHTETVHTVVWSPDGTKLATGSDDMTVRIWDAETYQQIRSLEGHNAMVTFVMFSPDGKLLASGGADYNCRLWVVETGELKHELSGHKGMVWTAAFDPEVRRVATASDDGSVRIWSVETGEELVILHEHTGPVWVVAFTEDGKQIMSASSDSTVKICNSFSGERIMEIDGHDSMVNAAQFSPDGKYIATASSDNTVKLWNRADGTNLVTFNEHNDKVTHAVFSPDGLTLSSASDDGKIRIRLLSEFIKAEGEGDGED